MTDQQRKILVCLFAYTGDVNTQVMNSLFVELGMMSAQRGWHLQLTVRPGDAMLPRARNAAVSDFLAGDWTDLIFIDNDNHSDPGGFMRMIEAPVDVVGLPCRSRVDPLTWPVRWLTDRPIEVCPNGLIEVESVGTGIIRFSRSCIERMAEAAKDEWYNDPTARATGKSWPMFNYEIVNKHWWGEDHYFGTRWRDLGGTVWIVQDIVTHHYGTADFAHSIGGWLRDQPPICDIYDVKDNSNTRVENRVSAMWRVAPQASERPRVIEVPAISRGSVAVCIASRGRPELLSKTVERWCVGAERDDTRIVVALDEDESDTASIFNDADDRVFVSIAKREDTLGGKYNRIQNWAARSLIPHPTLYVLGVDMVAPTTKGWDSILLNMAGLYTDDIGAVYFGERRGLFDNVHHLAVTSRMVEMMGYFMPPYFPFWWHESWLDEVSKFIGRTIYAPVEMEVSPPKKTQGCQEVDFWANFFDHMRIEREETARRIITSKNFHAEPWQRAKLLQEMPILGMMLRQREANLRTPSGARATEAQWSDGNAVQDERYLRVKAQAEEKLNPVSEAAE